MSSNSNGVQSPNKAGFFETRAIEYIPLRERHGKPWHVTPVWVSSSANLAGLALGTFGIFLGLNLLWSVVAIAVGGLFGTFFAAFHASQGPQLGLPQMIQSRPQFGYVGAVLIFVIALMTYLGMSVFATALMGQTAHQLLGVNPVLGMIVSTIVATILAVVGYNLVHRVSRYATILFIIVIVVLIVALPMVVDLPTVNASAGGFSLAAFVAQASAVAVATMSWAPYVSDYTRYLPHLSLKASFWGTYVGMAGTAILVTSIAAVGFAAFPKLDVVAAIQSTGDLVFPGFGAIFLGVAFLGTIVMVTMNFYGGSLTLMSAIDSFRPVKPRPVIRPLWTVAFGVVSLLIAIVASGELVNNFLNFLTVLFYFLAPWTAINLVDFYFVRRAHYSIREIFNPHGMYGRWNWRGYTAFSAAFLASVPFMVTAWWSGPLGAIIGIDFAPFVGMAVAGTVYALLARSLDLSAEQAQIAIADAGLNDDPAAVESVIEAGIAGTLTTEESAR